jgi:hypothetical protein
VRRFGSIFFIPSLKKIEKLECSVFDGGCDYTCCFFSETNYFITLMSSNFISDVPNKAYQHYLELPVSCIMTELSVG